MFARLIFAASLSLLYTTMLDCLVLINPYVVTVALMMKSSHKAVQLKTDFWNTRSLIEILFDERKVMETNCSRHFSFLPASSCLSIITELPPTPSIPFSLSKCLLPMSQSFVFLSLHLMTSRFNTNELPCPQRWWRALNHFYDRAGTQNKYWQ